MFSWLRKEESRHNDAEIYNTVVDNLKEIYKSKLLPLEEQYLFHEFHSPKLDDPDFDAKPMIVLVGQYSTGKTTFIKYLLEKEYPGMRINAEPTTDHFIAVMYGQHPGIIPGNALVVDPKKQFHPLTKFGNSFLNRLQCSLVDCEVLQNLTIVDTPGILSGEKQRLDRGYDFASVLEWFADRADRIILLFDAHKLDISDEFRRSIEAMKGHDEKIRIILNKADMVNPQQLMRVYGALMWSLGKILNTPEVTKIYLGSFWDQPLKFDCSRKLFEAEEQDLFQDFQFLPRNAALRKLNDLVKRARLAKVHAYIISTLRSNMPTVFGKVSKKRELIKNLRHVYDEIQRVHHVTRGDLPDIHEMQTKLMDMDFSRFQSLKPSLINTVNKMLAHDIAHLMEQIPHEQRQQINDDIFVKGGAFDGVQKSPFSFGKGEGVDEGSLDSEWIVNKGKKKWDVIFETLRPIDGKITGASAKAEMIKSKLPNVILGKVWKLSDVDNDGMLDSDEFALAMHLIEVKLRGHDLPLELPVHLLPPSKKGHF